MNQKVLKFGGTSMGSFNALEKVVSIIQKNLEDNIVQVITCSAMSQVTNKLIEIGNLAENGEVEKTQNLFKSIQLLHFDVAMEFGVLPDFEKNTENIWTDLHDLFHGICMIHELSDRSLAYLSSFGEKLSTRLLTCILNKDSEIAIQLDSSFVKTLDDDYLEADIDWKKTKKNVKKEVLPYLAKKIPIVTGFFGTNDKNITALLGRGGSDYSAAILAVCLGIKTVEIWTDVDGFLSADPRILKEAHIIPEIGYTEASELCSFGAKVLHPKTIRPVIDFGGEVWIKNTFSPEKPGTMIVQEMGDTMKSVLSITSKKTVIFTLNLFGVKMGTPRSKVYYSLFKICNKFNVCIDMIASSEASVSFCLEPSWYENKDFISALKEVAPLDIENNKSILCIVSPSNVKGRVGVAASFFQALAVENISAEMYSQNKQEVAQLIVVKNEDCDKAICAIHNQFSK